jgi:hypothetical protein
MALCFLTKSSTMQWFRAQTLASDHLIPLVATSCETQLPHDLRPKLLLASVFSLTTQEQSSIP